MLTELPTGPGVECAARYLPAVTGLNVGGDWYDAFRRPDGTLVLAVGDVAGHGLAAATLMGQLRTAMRAYAMDLPEAGEVLTRLHALIRHIDPDHCATAILAMVSPEGRMSIATAGHPPPLLRDPGGTGAAAGGPRANAGPAHRPHLHRDVGDGCGPDRHCSFTPTG